MTLNQLKRQLLNELKANGKKSAALGLLAMVGIYMWIPMLMGKEKKTRELVEFDATAAVLAVAAQSIPPVAADDPLNDWGQVQQWISHDPRMQPADVSLKVEPFELPYQESVEVEPEESEAVETETTPLAAGLHLTSTIVGSQRRVALINGKAYVEGKPVKAISGEVFHLVLVGDRHIILQRNGQRYELRIGQGGDPSMETSPEMSEPESY
jgi:hypothetical protein